MPRKQHLKQIVENYQGQFSYSLSPFPNLYRMGSFVPFYTAPYNDWTPPVTRMREMPLPSSQTYRIVSFYTPDRLYKEHAKNLKASLDKFSLSYTITEHEPLTGWEQTCAAKAAFIYEEWKKSDKPIVWLDADATVESYPSLFDQIDADFAIHKWKGWQFASGTLYFAKTPTAEKLLQQWLLRCNADPLTWDQIHLQSAWCDLAATKELKTFYLPLPYLQIFDCAEEEGPAVIKHWQASRKGRNLFANRQEASLKYTALGEKMRNSNQPWRTAEEAFWITQGENHIKPNTGVEFPEGDYVEKALREAIGNGFPVLEFGCGAGRLAAFFSPEEYIGADINPRALLQAQKKLPQHKFRLIDEGIALPSANSIFLYTALLHISDDKLSDVLSQIAATGKRVIFAEIMDNRWRREGNPPVFNRNPETYILEMQKLSYHLSSCKKYPYDRYETTPWNIGKDTRLTILTFDKE